MMIEDDDRLFFSQQESFYAPKVKRETRPPSALDGDLESIEGSKRANLLLDVVGPYDVGDLLGKGGFGEVREGTNQLSGEKVALKFLRRSEIQSMGAVNRTANEINCLATLKHRNIIKLYMVQLVC
jgi:serine/threonine protein kinase